MRPGKRPEVRDWFKEVFPEKAFIPLDRVTICFVSSLRDSLKILILKSKLPKTPSGNGAEFVEQEKWPPELTLLLV